MSSSQEHQSRLQLFTKQIYENIFETFGRVEVTIGHIFKCKMVAATSERQDSEKLQISSGRERTKTVRC